jgi:glycosyltransferase involved in cell wall biosynthesis
MPKVLLEMEKVKQPYAGLGRVCQNLGLELSQILTDDIRPLFMIPKRFFGMFGKNSLYTPTKKVYRALNGAAPKCDLWHAIHQDSPYFPKDSKTPYLLTIHDLNFLYDERKKDKKEKYLARLQKKIDRATAVTTISEYVKKDVLENLHIPIHTHFEVIPMAPSFIEGDADEKPSLLPKRKFFFSIAAIHPKKNFHTLLPMMEKFEDFDLVLAGPLDHSYAKELIDQTQKMNLSSRIFFPGALEEQQKNWYLKNCTGFLFPSLMEGFGIPPLEAMRFGKPVFLSKLTSLPEIGGPHAYYFDNFSADHMAHVIKRGLEDFAHSPNKAQDLIDWSKKFSWKETARMYSALYKKILS